MTFFKKYNGTTHKGLARLETLIWSLVYGGLLAIVVGLFMGRAEPGSGDVVMAIGGIAAVAGVVMIFVRSRLREER